MRTKARYRPTGLLLLLAGMATCGPGVASAQSALEIMRKERELHRLRDEEETLILKLFSKTGAVKERKIVRYTLMGPDDLDKILVRFLAPREVENTAVLTWEAKDGNDDQWLYLPATRKPKRIASSAKRNRFMGTDFSFEDMRPESLASQAYTLAGSATVDGQDCFVIEAVPGTEREAADSGYSKRRIWIRKDNHAVVRREYFNKPGRLEKVETRRNFVNVKGTVWRAKEIEMHDVQNGTRTIATVESRAVDRGLKERFFSEAELIR